MAAITAATQRRESAGSLTLNIYTFTTIADADTFASGLGTAVVDFWVSGRGNPTTQASAGINVDNSSGTFTFYPGENSLGATMFILSLT